MKLKLMLSAIMLMASSTALADFVVEAKIHFQDGVKWVGASDTCVSGDFIIHPGAQPREICMENGQGDKVNCRYEAADFDQPMASTRVRCDRREGERQGGACLEWVTVDFIQTALVKNYVYSSRKDWEEGGAPIAVEEYTIPACADGGAAAN